MLSEKESYINLKNSISSISNNFQMNFEKNQNLNQEKKIASPNSPIKNQKKVYFKDPNFSKENEKDCNNSNSTNNNTFSLSGNLSGNLCKISPLPKPDFSSIMQLENSLSYKSCKNKALQGSSKKIKLNVPNSPIKTPRKYTFTPNGNNNKGKNSIEKILEQKNNTCRKLNFFESDKETKENKESFNTTNFADSDLNTISSHNISNTAYKASFMKNDLNNFSNFNNFNGSRIFNQSTIKNPHNSEFILNNDTENCNTAFKLDINENEANNSGRISIRNGAEISKENEANENLNFSQKEKGGDLFAFSLSNFKENLNSNLNFNKNENLIGKNNENNENNFKENFNEKYFNGKKFNENDDYLNINKNKNFNLTNKKKNKCRSNKNLEKVPTLNSYYNNSKNCYKEHKESLRQHSYYNQNFSNNFKNLSADLAKIHNKYQQTSQFCLENNDNNNNYYNNTSSNNSNNLSHYNKNLNSTPSPNKNQQKTYSLLNDKINKMYKNKSKRYRSSSIQDNLNTLNNNKNNSNNKKSKRNSKTDYDENIKTSEFTLDNFNNFNDNNINEILLEEQNLKEKNLNLVEDFEEINSPSKSLKNKLRKKDSFSSGLNMDSRSLENESDLGSNSNSEYEKESFIFKLDKKLSLNEIPIVKNDLNNNNYNNSPYFMNSSSTEDKAEKKEGLFNKKIMSNFYRENNLNSEKKKRVPERENVKVKEFKLEDPEEEINNKNIKKNLFDEFDKKESFKLYSKLSFNGIDLEEENSEKNNQEENENMESLGEKKELYYNKLINEINLFEKFSDMQKEKKEKEQEIKEFKERGIKETSGFKLFDDENLNNQKEKDDYMRNENEIKMDIDGDYDNYDYNSYNNKMDIVREVDSKRFELYEGKLNFIFI